MTILRIYIAVLLLLGSLAGGAQVRPDQFPLKTTHTGTDFEIYSQYGGVNEKTTPYYLKYYYAPNVDSAWQAFTFTDSIGVVDSLRMMFLKDNRGRVFYVDADGDVLLLKDTAQAVGNVYALATLADTSTVASPVEGDIAVIGSDTLLFYETYWLMFAGGAGGIYGGSGTVPASTWVEQLGSLIFDIDSIGSFTVGDIDEKSTGAYISISNTGGNDGAIVMKSGSGKGTTDATIELNNYYLPGTTPTGEGLPSGDYFWIVSNAGVRKGQDSTGWIHIDSLLQGYTTGSGTSGTIPIWNGTASLGNSSLTEASGVLSSSLTGALKLPAGTDAQDPVWSAGMLRYNTTANGIQGYDGTAERYLLWANADNIAVNRIPYSDGSQLISSSGITYDGNTLKSTGDVEADDDIFVADDLILESNGSWIQSYEGTSMGIIFNNNPGIDIVYYGFSYDRTVRFRNRESTGIAAQIGYNRVPGPSLSTKGHCIATNFITGMSSTDMFIRGFANVNASQGDGRNVNIYGGTGAETNRSSGNVRIYGGPISEVISTPPNYSGTPGHVELYSFPDPDSLAGPGTAQLVVRVAGTTHNTELYHIGQTTTGIRTLTMESDTVKYRVENLGAISTSTDGSGDIVVAHGMGVTPTVVDIQFTGTSGSATPYVYVVLTDGTDATNFTIRVFDMTGAAVTSTAVTATWHCKT